MSVAFRRESDDEHLEPKFELPIPPGPNLVTARGLRLIRDEVVALEAVDSSGHDEEAVKKLRRTLRYWRTRLATAQVQPVPAGDVVAFGARVAYRLNGAEKHVVIVGHDEADPHDGRISFTSPLARALTGAEVGECVDFAGKADAIEILDIQPIAEQ
ncbi:MAG: GreA/GreB family elongation factor [Sphingobium sp.]